MSSCEFRHLPHSKGLFRQTWQDIPHSWHAAGTSAGRAHSTRPAFEKLLSNKAEGEKSATWLLFLLELILGEVVGKPHV